MKSPYGAPLEELVQALNTDVSQGLTREEAANRLARDGPNELNEAPGPTLWAMLWSQISEPLVLVLILAALISSAVGELTDALVIFLIVILNAGLGVWQERRAERSLAALRKLGTGTARVIRDGEAQNVDTRDLVRGDLILIEEGDFIPADGRLIEAANLAVDESALTGESVPAEKGIHPPDEPEVSIGDRTNMIHKSTIVTYGRGKAIVTATGMGTEIGKIADLIQQAPEIDTPLQRRLASLGKGLGFLALALVVVIFIAGVIQGIDTFEMFMTSVSLAVAAIPEGLPAIVTIVLALGVQRMSKRRAIIRKLPAVESLGSATVICSDKTGTLTQNRMTVQKLWVGGGFQGPDQTLDELGRLLVLAGALNSNASIVEQDGNTQVVGDPTEGALVSLAIEHGLKREDVEPLLPRVAEAPFDSDRKRMTTLHRVDRAGSGLDWAWERIGDDSWVSFTKGAPDLVLERVTHVLTQEGIVPLSDAFRDEILKANQEMAEDALRVLAVGMRTYQTPPAMQPKELAEAAEQQLVLLGLVGMMDPPRPEARQAIAVARKAGVRTIMITGDHLTTAKAIGRNLGLLTEKDEAITGRELDEMDEETLRSRVGRVSVFARVSPEHKVRIVQALQANGELVAMTGDGVNDAPALQGADIGAAMGMTGTDVAKEAADMVLTDDNFATIIAAVSEGRTIFSNIKKAIRYLLACNAGELLAIFTAILIGWPRPLVAVQILWVNLVTDGFPALALGVEPGQPTTMERPPRDPKGPLFSKREMRSVLFTGTWIGGTTLVAFWLGWSMTQNEIVGRTMAFATLAFTQLFQAVNCRTEHVPIYRIGFFSNPSMIWALLGSAVLQIFVLTIPILQRAFGTTSMTLVQWVTVVLLSASIFVFSEVGKVFKSRSMKTADS